ncbi:MAG: hypothetical protein ACM3ZT_01380 [Bacillota bacterium]
MMPLREIAACVIAAMLAGCASQRAEILGDAPQGHADAAFISVPEDEYFWIAPPPSGRHGAAPAETQILKNGAWVSEGWLMVQFQCYAPKDAPRPGVDPILPESPDEKAVFVHGGHRYRLSCDRRQVGRFEFEDEPAAAR